MNTADADELVSRFWDELQKVRTGMLGLAGAREAHSQPMTAYFEGPSGPLWFYTRNDSELLAATGQDERAVFHYVGLDHDLYACVHGKLAPSRDQVAIDRFWSDEIERWFPQGREDGSVALLRFDPEEAQIWLPNHSADRSVVRLDSSAEPPVDVHVTAPL